MNYQIFINEKKLSGQAHAAIEEYCKRLSPYCKVSVFMAKNKTGGNKRSLSSCKPIYVLPDSSGKKTVSSETFAASINDLEASGSSVITYLIGYPVPPEIQPPAECFISGMSLSNEIMAIALAEQIYRGYTINHHIPYHK